MPSTETKFPNLNEAMQTRVMKRPPPWLTTRRKFFGSKAQAEGAEHLNAALLSPGQPLQRFKIQWPDTDWTPLPSQKKSSGNNKEFKKEQDQNVTVKEIDSEKITSPATEKIQELISDLQNSLKSDSKNGLTPPNFSTLTTNYFLTQSRARGWSRRVLGSKPRANEDPPFRGPNSNLNSIGLVSNIAVVSETTVGGRVRYVWRWVTVFEKKVTDPQAGRLGGETGLCFESAERWTVFWVKEIEFLR
ncbi:hypothetical protein TNCV_865021 [Trichonephila clavipes]|nr:hypothetical protein TNCV_865021 [Trichonephila clavipes]